MAGRSLFPQGLKRKRICLLNRQSFSRHIKPKPALIVLVTLILLWAILAWLVADPITLPSPAKTWYAFLSINNRDQLWYHLPITLLRVLFSVILAMSLGTVIGLMMGRYPRFNDYAEPVIGLLLNMPALIIAILSYLFIGFNEFALVFAVSLNKIPMVAITMREGMRTLNPDIAAVAHLYHMPKSAYLRHVAWPQLMPYFTSSLRNGLALIWKIILVFEFLGRPNGIGFEIQKYFQLFRVDMILAYSLSFIVVMMLIDRFLVAPWDQKMQKWRKAYAYSY